METLGDALPREMARVRDKVMPAYLAIGIAGAPALAVMRDELDRATTALAQGDVIEMLQLYESLKGWSV
jgi:hypothetical protein